MLGPIVPNILNEIEGMHKVSNTEYAACNPSIGQGHGFQLTDKSHSKSPTCAACNPSCPATLSWEAQV